MTEPVPAQQRTDHLTLPRTAPRPPGVVLHTVDLTEHTRLLGEVAPALKDLSVEAARIREGEIAKPVREIAPLSLRVHELAMKCTRQVHDLSVSQYPAMKDGGWLYRAVVTSLVDEFGRRPVPRTGGVDEFGRHRVSCQGSIGMLLLKGAGHAADVEGRAVRGDPA
ncbi:hypothetical protein ACFUAC_10590 [Streptomyces sp. NPDC057148]|uniref:hypothetical protein n=1 Tax=unclassified Streptomyces TaxID=2593676 RepID=UPI00363837F9